MSTVAVFIALGGTSYAVSKLPKNSVGSEQVRDGSLAAGDLAPGVAISGPRGPRGAEGPQGPAGATGPQGPAAATQVEGWHLLEFLNSWGSYSNDWERASYRKDPFGVVHLRGLISQLDGLPTRSVIAVLPPGYRPAKLRMFAVHTGEPHSLGRIDVASNGALSWISGTSANETDYTSLEGIEFDAAG